MTTLQFECRVPGCGKPRCARGLCNTHYANARRAGSLPPPLRYDSSVVAERFAAYCSPEPMTGCTLWAGPVTGDGYGQIALGASKSESAHRYAYRLHKGEPGERFVCHRCDQPACVNPDHLFLGTCADNTADMVAKGRQARGLSHGRAKLTPELAAEIHASWKAGATFKSLAARFGVSQTCIRQVCRGMTWTHATLGATP